jgi:hypothetical protein
MKRAFELICVQDGLGCQDINRIGYSAAFSSVLLLLGCPKCVVVLSRRNFKQVYLIQRYEGISVLIFYKHALFEIFCFLINLAWGNIRKYITFSFQHCDVF